MVSGCDSDVRPAAHSPRSSPDVSPTHSYIASSSSSTSNGFVSNGTCIDNGFDADNMPMEVEDFEESINHGVLNGTANTVDNDDHSSSTGITAYIGSSACSFWKYYFLLILLWTCSNTQYNWHWAHHRLNIIEE